MTPAELAAVRGRLEEFAAEVFAPLIRADQRDKGVTYLRGLLLDGRRKSMQPMAARLGVDEQGLQQFVSSSTWPVEPVRERLARRAVEVIGPDAWVVDDTGFPKFGTASPGVSRQYSGTLGKVANCQIGVSVHAVTDAASCPLSWRLFLPAGWDDAEAADEQAAAAIRLRRARAGIPGDVRHRPKWRLALDMLAELADWGLVPPVVVADAGYGNNATFRAGIAALGSCSVVQVEGDLTAHPAEATAELKPYSGRGPHPQPRYRTKAVGLREHALAAGRDATVALTWRDGSRGPLSSRFLAIRVRPTGRRPTGRLAADGSLPAAWLLAEWPTEASEPTDYWLSDLPETTPLPELVRAGEDPLADRARLPRTEDRPGAGPLRGPHLARLAPPRHPGQRRPAVHHPAANQPKSACLGLSLYAVLRQLQTLLATWTGTCTICGQHLDTRARAPT